MKPPKLLDEHLTYLDALRASGATNMYGAGAYLRDEYPNLNKPESHAILAYWMRTFGERNPKS